MEYSATPPTPPLPQAVVPYASYTDARDADHVRLLSIFHYVYGGIVGLFSCVFILYIVIGLFMVNGAMGSAATATRAGSTTMPVAPAPAPPPPAVGWLFVTMGGIFLLLGWTVAALTIASGRCLARRRARTFSLVMAGVNCLSVPLGTTLGVFTFIVLLRESVAAMYAAERR